MFWYCYLFDKIKQNFFQAVAVSRLLYEYTTWTQTKRLQTKLDGNYTRMLRAILTKSSKYQSMKKQLYGHLPLISKTIQVRRTRYAGYFWRNKDVIICDVLLWTPIHGHVSVGRPTRIYLYRWYKTKFSAALGVVWKTCRERWMIGMDEEREPGKSLLWVLLVDDDDDEASTIRARSGGIMVSKLD